MQTIAKQLELDLWQQLKVALSEPEAVGLSQLWQKLEQTIANSEQDQQLLLAGDAITKIVEVYVLRAKAILARLEVRDHSKGPVLSEDFLNGLIRQSMSVNLSDLMEDLFSEDEALLSEDSPDDAGSVAAPVDKSTAQAIAREARVDANQMMEAVAEKENVSEWVKAIAQWMERNSHLKPVSLIQLQQGLEMPLVEIWLGMLLAKGEQFELKSNEDFYSEPKYVFVKNN